MQPQVRVHPFQQHLYDVSVPVSRVKAAGRGAMCVCVCVSEGHSESPWNRKCWARVAGQMRGICRAQHVRLQLTCFD